MFPIGLFHLNSALRRHGHETRWFDLQTDHGTLESVLNEFRPTCVGISIRNIDDVLIRKREVFFSELGTICRDIQRWNPCPIVLGGSGFSIFPQPLLDQSGADFGIRGEGELSLVALLSALSNGSDWTGIPGLVFRRNGEVVVNSLRPLPLESGLDTTDRPVPLVEHYLQASGMMNLQTQRGCSHTCCYCTYPVIEGRTHRSRPPEVVAEELAQLQGLGVKYVVVVDSVFNSTEQHVVETCEAILRRNVTMRWSCFLRPEGLTTELMKLMARAGLAHIEFGSDSFCDAVLEAYGKRLTFEQINRSSELARQEGIDYCHYLICGGPGETLATLETSFQNSLRLSGAVIMAIVGMRVYPGTPLLQRALAEGCVAPDADLLTPTFYLAPGLTTETVFERLHSFAQRFPSWIVGDPSPANVNLTERLRQRGVVGPLWSYFALIQRLWPQPAAEINA
ncbi:MAG: radical SAM protein [Verrucomicrobia bacterium]|nr:radical SAM protein [Verrucomicrobiota bacterium]